MVNVAMKERGMDGTRFHVDGGPRLFVDDVLIECTQGLTRRGRQPERVGDEPLPRKDKPWEHRPDFTTRADCLSPLSNSKSVDGYGRRLRITRGLPGSSTIVVAVVVDRRATLSRYESTTYSGCASELDSSGCHKRLLIQWCPGWDSNPHTLADKGF